MNQAASPRRRVALVVASLATGGVERQVLALAAGLDRERFEVEVIALKAGGALSEAARQAGIACWTAHAGNGFDLSAVARLARHLRRSRPHAVMAANQYATLVLRAAVLFAPRPERLLSAFHSSPSLVSGSPRDRLRFALYRQVLRAFDGLLYVSRRQRDEWQALGLAPRVPALVVHNGIDVARFAVPPSRDVRRELGWSPQDFVVGLCAALRPEKQAQDLLAAAARLVGQGVPLRLLLIGDGPERAALEQAASALGIADRLRITGLQGDVAPFIHACDVMTLVSRTEAFSLSVLEAMACGKPVVLTAVGGAAEQVLEGEQGHLVPVGDPAALADRLLQLWRDGRAPRMGASARERAQREFSLQRMVDDYARLFCDASPTAPPIVAPTPAGAPHDARS